MSGKTHAELAREACGAHRVSDSGMGHACRCAEILAAIVQACSTRDAEISDLKDSREETAKAAQESLLSSLMCGKEHGKFAVGCMDCAHELDARRIESAHAEATAAVSEMMRAILDKLGISLTFEDGKAICKERDDSIIVRLAAARQRGAKLVVAARDFIAQHDHNKTRTEPLSAAVEPLRAALAALDQPETQAPARVVCDWCGKHPRFYSELDRVWYHKNVTGDFLGACLDETQAPAREAGCYYSLGDDSDLTPCTRPAGHEGPHLIGAKAAPLDCNKGCPYHCDAERLRDAMHRTMKDFTSGFNHAKAGGEIGKPVPQPETQAAGREPAMPLGACAVKTLRHQGQHVGSVNCVDWQPATPKPAEGERDA